MSFVWYHPSVVTSMIFFAISCSPGSIPSHTISTGPWMSPHKIDFPPLGLVRTLVHTTYPDSLCLPVPFSLPTRKTVVCGVCTVRPLTLESVSPCIFPPFTTTDNEVLCRLVDRWVGQGGKTSLANTTDVDILEYILVSYRQGS